MYYYILFYYINLLNIYSIIYNNKNSNNFNKLKGIQRKLLFKIKNNKNKFKFMEKVTDPKLVKIKNKSKTIYNSKEYINR